MLSGVRAVTDMGTQMQYADLIHPGPFGLSPKQGISQIPSTALSHYRLSESAFAVSDLPSTVLTGAQIQPRVQANSFRHHPWKKPLPLTEGSWELVTVSPQLDWRGQ